MQLYLYVHWLPLDILAHLIKCMIYIMNYMISNLIILIFRGSFSEELPAGLQKDAKSALSGVRACLYPPF